MKFNREIGDYAGKLYSVEGDPLKESEIHAHLAQVLPGLEDQKILQAIFKAENSMTVGANG